VAHSKRFYVYAIHVDGVLRYIGKGCNGRKYAHMKEVRQRLTREFNRENVWPVFQRRLTEAVMQGAVVEEFVLADNLTSKQAYKLEYRRLEEMVLRREAPAAVERHSAHHQHARGARDICEQARQKPDKQGSLGPISLRNHLILLNQNKKWAAAIGNHARGLKGVEKPRTFSAGLIERTPHDHPSRTNRCRQPVRRQSPSALPRAPDRDDQTSAGGMRNLVVVSDEPSVKSGRHGRDSRSRGVHDSLR
jgi:hypothetical protein